ncbi:MAG: peptidoglycan DD-metalloendopeptidase family protein [Myxococcales bacterium]|nr:peptidoglycan DD-metalloendopeptidase family protein [Myxococcales bacterium]
MQPLTQATALCAALAALSQAAEQGRPLVSSPPARPPVPGAAAAPPRAFASACPQGTLPDQGVCIPVPQGALGGAALEAEQNVHRDKRGAWRFYDQIPRRPERPSDYRRYRWPVPPLPGQNLVVSGYDLDRPDVQQRRGTHIKAVGHGGLDLGQRRGAEVRLVALEHQTGEAEVLFVGEVFGNSVVTRHSVREGDRLREYVIVYGHLEGPAPGLSRGMNLREGSLIGFVGDSGSPGDVHLHLEVRRVREGVNVASLAPGELTKNARTVVCDPRNVMPLASE